MNKNMKKINLLLLSTIISLSACSSPNADLQKAIDEIRNTSVTVPNTDRGAVSGTVEFAASVGSVTPETTVKIVRDVDIPEKDVNGKVVIDPKTKKNKLLEKKGQVVGTAKVTSSGSFLVTNLRPGAVIVNISNKSSSNEVLTNIEAGKVTELKNIDFASISSSRSSTLNITGQVISADGTPVANAKITDVTGGGVGTFTNTNADGEFTLPVIPFTNLRNLEISSGNLLTSLAVSPEQIEGLVIPLIANSRTVKGTVFDSVNKDKPISNAAIKVTGTNTSAVTDAKGNFTLRGVPLNATSLELGDVVGYLPAKISVSASTTSETQLGSVFIQPIGNLFVNLTVESTPGTSDIIAGSTCPDGYVPITQKPPAPNQCYYDNRLIYPELSGIVQIEGTQIVTKFILPQTPTVTVKRYISETESEDVIIHRANFAVSVPINNIPGGEYNLSISLPFHQTQKGIKVVIPSNDTIATEEIVLKPVLHVISIGDIFGKILIKDRDGNLKSLPAGYRLRITAISDASDPVDLSAAGVVTNLLSIAPAVNTAPDGSYTLSNVATGTKILLAGVFKPDNTLSNDYLPATYTLLNVVGGTINKAPELTVIERQTPVATETTTTQ